MFPLLFRIFLIGLVVYFIIALVFGWYTDICMAYWWMMPVKRV